MKKNILFIATIVLVTLLFSVNSYATAGNGVDWDKEIIVSVGMGVVPRNALSAGQAKLLARRAALVDAYRNLGEQIEGVQIDSETTVRNAMVENDIIVSKMSSFIKGAKVIKESFVGGIYEITVSVNLYGDNGLGQIINVSDSNQKQLLSIPKASPEYIPPVIDRNAHVNVSSSSTVGGYTGLVIDARGLNLQRCMSPKVYDETGREVYGTMYISDEYLLNTGIIGYAANQEVINKINSGTSRSGNNPIKVKARAVRNHNYNVVISKEDADAIFYANQQSDFLQKCAVMIIK